MTVRTPTTWLLASSVLVVVGCGGQSSSEFSPGGPPPFAARVLVTRLVSSPHARDTISPALSAILPPGRILPPNSQLVLDTRGWRQSGQFANATGMLEVVLHQARKVEVGFRRSRGGWRITFLESAQ
jgi:hypothetical protein